MSNTVYPLCSGGGVLSSGCRGPLGGWVGGGRRGLVGGASSSLRPRKKTKTEKICNSLFHTGAEPTCEPTERGPISLPPLLLERPPPPPRNKLPPPHSSRRRASSNSYSGALLSLSGSGGQFGNRIVRHIASTVSAPYHRAGSTSMLG